MGSTASLQSFWNGRWVPHRELHVAVDDLGFTQAVTAVERLRTYGARIFQTDRHLQRFASTVAALQIAGLPDQRTLQELSGELLQRNRRWLREQREAGVVLFATPGAASHPALWPQHHEGGLSDASPTAAPQPTLVAYLMPLPLARIADRIHRGQPLVITDVRQTSLHTWPRHLKVRSRLHYFLADRHATAVDPRALGILLDEDSTVTETSVANLAIVGKGRIISPPAARVLPGITQAVAEEIAAELKIAWDKRPLSIAEMHTADEVLLFGTTTGIWPGWLVNDATDSGHRSSAKDGADGGQAASTPANAGPVFRALRKRFDELCLGDRRGS